MGNCATAPAKEGDQESKVRNKAINKEMKQSKVSMSKEVKLLLLGAGESGKSTIFKQMKIIHHNGYSREECMMYKDIVYANTLQSMKVLVNATVKLSIPIEDPENRERAQRIANLDSDALLHVGKIFTPDLGKDLASLWKDKGIQETFGRRSEYQLNDSADYYFNNLERLSQPDYVPTEQDVLRSRVKTTGIVETEFDYGAFHFRMFDVGGQRNERKKWIHCFQGVTAVIFVTSLSEYDQKCYEDDSTNRMKESLLLFDEICNSRWFTETSIILFLNKVDLFKEKIRKIDLNVCFPDYTGGCNFDSASKFVAQKFIELNKSDTKQVYTHFTCATDTNNVKNVFDCVRDIILHNNLRDNGLL